MRSGKKLKKKVWRCEHGCEIEKTGIPCEHLERLLNEGNTGPQYESVNQRYDIPIDSYYYSSGAGFVIPEGIKSGRYESQFRTKLAKYGITKLQVDILVHTYIYNETLKDISVELGMPSLTTVLRLRTEALQTLKKKGFGKR